MTIIHCDGCGAVIDDPKKSISIGGGWFLQTVQLCATCGAAAAALLDRVVAKRHSDRRELQIEA